MVLLPNNILRCQLPTTFQQAPQTWPPPSPIWTALLCLPASTMQSSHSCHSDF